MLAQSTTLVRFDMRCPEMIAHTTRASVCRLWCRFRHRRPYTDHLVHDCTIACEHAGWTYSWNVGRMEVDARHPSIVKSEYVENLSEEMLTSIPPAEQQAALRVREYCTRNFDLVVGTSFGFTSALVHMSSEPICNFWYNETSGNLTAIPMITYLLHGTGDVQVRNDIGLDVATQTQHVRHLSLLSTDANPGNSVHKEL